MISSTDISRVIGISEAWIQEYASEKYESIPKRIDSMLCIFKKAVYAMKSGHCRKIAVFCSDFWSTYKDFFLRFVIFLSERKKLNLRQCAARLARKMLSFSENIRNHMEHFRILFIIADENIAPNLAATP